MKAEIDCENGSQNPNDLTDDKWKIVKPLIPLAKRGDRPRTVNMGEVLNAIIDLLKTGCQWDHLPHDFPPKGTVYHYFNTWRIDETWARIVVTRSEILQAAGVGLFAREAEVGHTWIRRRD